MADDAAQSAADSSAYQSVEKGEEKFPSAPPRLSNQDLALVGPASMWFGSLSRNTNS